MKSLGVVFLCFQLCLTEGSMIYKQQEVPDITAVYHVGRNSSVDYMDIHLRTDALGLPVAVGGQLAGPEDLEFHLDSHNLNTWEHLNWTLVTTNTSAFLPSVVHDGLEFSGFHPFSGGIHISVKDPCTSLEIVLTPDKTPLKLLPLFYYIFSDSCTHFIVHACGNEIRDPSHVSVGSEIFNCRHKGSFNKWQRYYYTWYIKQENYESKLWFDYLDSQPKIKWNSPVKIKFFKMISRREVNAEIFPLVDVLETTNMKAKLISPPFTPKYKSICMTVVIYISELTYFRSDVYVQNMLLDKIFLGSFEADELMIGDGWHTKRLITQWPGGTTSTKVRLLLETSLKTGNLKLERISSCNGEDGEDVILLQDKEIVPFSDITTPMLRYKDDSFQYINEEELCWHNGVQIGYLCACPPGFGGLTCEKGCGRNKFGKDCKGKCSVHTSECRGLLLCTPEVGCYCAPGYKGDTCEEECESGKYGNNCTQTCGHCAGGTCDIYSGECFSCLPGYQLPFCKHKYTFTSSAPLVSVTRFGEVTVKPIITNITNNSNLDFYSIQYKKNFTSDSWVSHSIHPFPRTGDVQETVIKDLEHGIPYTVRTVLIDRDFNSYQGEDIPAADFLSLCIIPKRPDYHIETESSQTSFNVSWSNILENAYWCRVEKFEVSWKEGWKWLTSFTNNTYITIADLLPSTTVRFKVRALTSKGFAPYSPTVLVSTKDSGSTVPVENLRVETVGSRTAMIHWDPPLGRYNVDLSYSVKYKCLRQVACQKNCEESADELHVLGTHIKLAVLYPFSQYLVTVSPEGGPSRNIILGTKMSEPKEIPELSSRPPVRTNTSITVYWNHPEVCSGPFTNYVYQFYKVGEVQLVETGSTVNTSVSFDNLQVSTDYKVLVYVQTYFGDVNPSKYLEINVSTLATVPEKVQNVTVYKQGRYLLGLRWASPNKTHGSVIFFTIKYGYREDTDYKTEIVKPNPCVVWPHLFCHTIKYLQVDKVYKISVSARNAEVDADGASVEVTGITKEKSPEAPENIKVLKVTSHSLLIQWDHPWMANGIVRSFLISVEETEQFEEEKCCQVHPISEIIVTDEREHYSIEVAGLNAASTYVVSVSAKTVALGSAQSITVHTQPPSLAFAQLPNVTVNGCSDVLMWLPQKHNFTSNSDLYKTLIKGSLLLVLSNDTELNSSGIKDKKLDNELKSIITEDFYLAAEYTDKVATMHIELGTGVNVNGKWGNINNLPLQQNNTYQLAAVQVAEYCGVYGVDIVWSSPFVVL